ncbi:hypothetical protein MMC10_005782 [Thelotrema lepadinum]|nr:hypothetical protein [Thelotrema lepadinum]
MLFLSHQFSKGKHVRRTSTYPRNPVHQLGFSRSTLASCLINHSFLGVTPQASPPFRVFPAKSASRRYFSNELRSEQKPEDELQPSKPDHELTSDTARREEARASSARWDIGRGIDGGSPISPNEQNRLNDDKGKDGGGVISEGEVGGSDDGRDIGAVGEKGGEGEFKGEVGEAGGHWEWIQDMPDLPDISFD